MIFRFRRQKLRIAIIGGGIGGLTLALALRQRSLAAEVFEQTPELSEIGAAVTLSAKATRELRRLGVIDAIAAVSVWPQRDTWQIGVDPGEAAAAFKRWHPAVLEVVGAVVHKVRWGLFTVRPLRHWSRGRALLLGDAAHAMLPHHGQGANITIEDAIILAELLDGASPAELGTVLDRYQAVRRRRARKIQRSSQATNDLLHLPDGPALTERDRRVSRFAKDFGWIHEFDALRSVSMSGNRLPGSPAFVSS